MIKLEDLNALIEAVKKIRKYSPYTANEQSFREGIAKMDGVFLIELARAIDVASIAVTHVERAMLEVK